MDNHATQLGQPALDLVQFGRSHHSVEDGRAHLSVEWDQPRDVRRVILRPPGGPSTALTNADLSVRYWQHTWPQVDPDALPGTHRGWIPQDDHWHGRWVESRGAWSAEGEALVFEFDPLDFPELSDFASPSMVGSLGVRGHLDQRPGYRSLHRTTLKVQVVGPAEIETAALELQSNAKLRAVSLTAVRILGQGGEWEPNVLVHNGFLISSAPYESTDGVGVSLTVDAASVEPGSVDSTLVTFQTDSGDDPAGPEGCTIDVGDLAAGPLWLPDQGLFFRLADDQQGLAEYQATLRGARPSIYDQVTAEPEQTDARAQAEIPPPEIARHPPGGRYVVLGGEAHPHKFAVRYNGEVFADKVSLNLKNRDTRTLGWAGEGFRVKVGSGDPPDFRERDAASIQSLEGGYLPILHTTWTDRGVDYDCESFSAPLSGLPTTLLEQAEEPSPVLVMSATGRNVTTAVRQADLWLQFLPDEELSLDADGRLVAVGRLRRLALSPEQFELVAYPSPRLRAVVSAGDGSSSVSASVSVANVVGSTGTSGGMNSVHVRVTLPAEATFQVSVKIPFTGNDDQAEWDAVRSLDPDAARAAIVQAWEPVANAPASIRCPAAEPALDDFIRAVPIHILVNAVKDRFTGEVIVPAGTLAYGTCGNEAIWQVAALDVLGHHERARAMLESLLTVQGLIKPDGRFTSAEGALQAADFDMGRPKPNMFSYNLDHGVILHGLATHYRMTGDKAWLARIAPQLLAACDFVIRERATTTDLERPLRGLLPAGHLEDNPEWKYWFAVNAYAYKGLAAVADVFGEIDHPETQRLVDAARDYRADILSSVRAARVASPIVRLAGGSAVPHIPSRQELRGRELGWFRESGYGALHLWAGGVLDDMDPEVTWILQDIEDNQFLSPEHGFAADVERDWFSLGGAACQPFLLPIGMTYLYRDQIEHAVRAFYNGFRLTFYEDVRCLAEWVSEPGLGAGPFFKPSDEARAVTWLRNHLVLEQGSVLWLGKGTPRSWSRDGETYGVQDLPTEFGHVTFGVESHLTRDAAIAAEVRLKLRRSVGQVLFRLRHPDGSCAVDVTVNGRRANLIDPETVDLGKREAGEHLLQVVARYEAPS